jgi:hypothetical protein
MVLGSVDWQNCVIEFKNITPRVMKDKNWR